MSVLYVFLKIKQNQGRYRGISGHTMFLLEQVEDWTDIEGYRVQIFNIQEGKTNGQIGEAEE